MYSYLIKILTIIDFIIVFLFKVELRELFILYLSGVEHYNGKHSTKKVGTQVLIEGLVVVNYMLCSDHWLEH